MNDLIDIAALKPARCAGVDYLERGQGSQGMPLVLLHGIGSHARSFEPLMIALPESVRMIAWNAPGYGASQPLPMATPHPRDYADALLRLLDGLGLDRIVLVGHSLGCLFAASFAAHHAPRVSALMLMSPALGYHVPSGGVLPPAVQARIDDLAALGPASFAAKRAARLVFEPARKPAVIAGVQQAMAALNLAGYAQAVHALGAGNLLADAASIAAPTLVATGTEDVVTPPDNARATYAALSNRIGYHEIPDAGHALAQENPLAMANLVLQLIDHIHD